MDRRLLAERLFRLVDLINSSVDLVLVEGSRDEEAVRSLGLTTAVLRVSGRSLRSSLVYEVVELFRGRRVLVLTDFDEEGERLNRALSSHLSRMGVRVEEGLRRRVGEVLAEAGLREVEELPSIFKGPWPPHEGLSPGSE